MNKPIARFVANITKAVSASGVQFLITLCTTPIMTRLYAPAAYATFGIVNTTANVMIGIGLLSLPNAYWAEKIAAVRTEIIQTMVVLLLGLVALAAIVAATLAVVDVHHNGLDIPKLSLFLLPVLVLTYGARQIISTAAIQRANFNRLSLGQVIEPLCSRGGSVALGALLSGNPAFILISVALGHLSTIAVLSGMLPRRLYGHWRHVIAHLPKLIASLRRSGDFVFFVTLAQQVSQVMLLGMQLTIAAFFSKDLAGQYILAVSILTLPISLVALSTAPAVLHHFVETEKNEPARLARHFVVTTTCYLLAGAAILSPVFLFGEELFKVAIGAAWVHAGHIASVLSIPYVGMFAMTGVQPIFTVTRRLKLQFTLELGTCIPAMIAAFICFKTMDFDQAIFYLSLIWLLRNIVLLLGAFTAARQHPKHAL